MSEEKRTDSGVVLCNQKDCDMPATHTYVWTGKQIYSCMIHAQKALNIAEAMGFPTPAATMRPMTIDEMVHDDD